MKIGIKLTVCLLMFVLLIIIMGYVATVQLNKISESFHHRITASTERIKASVNLSELSDHIRYLDEVLTQSARNFAFTGEVKWEQRYRKFELELDGEIKKAIALGDEKDKDSFLRVDDANLALVEMEYRSIEFVKGGQNKEALKILNSAFYRDQKEIYLKEINKYEKRKSTTFGPAFKSALGGVFLAAKEVEDLLKKSERTNVIFAGVSLILALAIGLLLTVSIATPITKLKNATAEISKGELNTKVGIETKDEIGQLARSFDQMTKNLRETSVSKDYVDNIITSMMDSLIVINPKSKIMTVNKATCDLLGYEERELVGNDVGFLFLEEEEEEEEETPLKGIQLERLIKKGSLINFETHYVTKEGSKVPVLLSGAVLTRRDCPKGCLEEECPEFKKTGKHCEKLQGIVCIAKDVTERKKAEEELRQSEKRFMDVLHSSKDAILLIDSEAFVDANEATAQMLKYSSRKEFLMMHPSKLSPSVQPDGQNSFEKANNMMKIAVEQGFHRFEWIHRKKTGEDFPVEVSLTPITYKGKTVIHCLWKDLTERKKAEEKFKVLFMSARDAIMTLAPPTWKFVSANPSTLKLFEAEFETDFLSLGPGDVSPEYQPDGTPSAQSAKDAIESAMKNGSHFFEWTHKSLKGKEFAAAVLLTKCTIGGRDLLQATVRDITESKRSEFDLVTKSNELEVKNRNLIQNEMALRNMMYDMKETNDALKEAQVQLVQSEKMASVGQLAAGVAHEINNPLGYIINNLETLKKYVNKILKVVGTYDGLKSALSRKDTEKAMKVSKQILAIEEEMKMEHIRADSGDLINETLDGAKRIESIVLDLKMFSRTGGKERKSANINEILKRVVNIVWNEIKYTAKLKEEYGPLPEIMCDEQHLYQVFVNLLINASYAVKDMEGVIGIRTYCQDKHVCIEITDTGEGMPEDVLGKIFDPFFTTKEQGVGTGLGLSVSHEIIEKHGGTIEAHSTIGKGTQFLVSLPVKES